MQSTQFQRGYSIGEIARRAGVNLETVRYYERIGIMPKPDRLPNGYRQFSHEHLKRLSFIHRSRNLGFSLKTIRALLKLVDEDHLSCSEIHQMTLAHLSDVDEKLVQLQNLRAALKTMSDKCTMGNVPDCPVIDALFEVDKGV